jgi:arsenate reductase
MAEGFGRALGAGVIEAASAGLSPTPTVASDTIAAMAEKGIDISTQFPKEFQYKPASAYDVIVNMSGFDLPHMEKATVVEWDVRDPFYEGIAVFREVRDDIERRVRELIDDIREHGTVMNSQIVSYPGKKPGLWQRFTNWR